MKLVQAKKFFLACSKNYYAVHALNVLRQHNSGSIFVVGRLSWCEGVLRAMGKAPMACSCCFEVGQVYCVRSCSVTIALRSDCVLVGRQELWAMPKMENLCRSL